MENLVVKSYVVHIVTYIPDMLDGLRIRSVAAISKADLEILSVETAGARLIRELVPVGTDQARILQAGQQVVFVGCALALLVVGSHLARVEHSPVHRSEMELTKYNRQVDALRQLEVCTVEGVVVITHHVNVFSSDSDYEFWR